MKLLKSTFVWLAIIMSICACVTANAAETQAKKVLKVAFPETRGICETYADGTRGGIILKVWKGKRLVFLPRLLIK